MTQTNIESFEKYMHGSFLKAIHVESDKQAFACINIEEVTEKDNTKRIRLTLQKNGMDYEFDLNQTNLLFLINSQIKPMQMIGKKVYFKKALARNPKTNLEVEALRIYKVE